MTFLPSNSNRGRRITFDTLAQSSLLLYLPSGVNALSDETRPGLLAPVSGVCAVR
jgi:hypothetical protein